MSAVSLNNQLKTVLMPKRHILGCHIRLPFIPAFETSPEAELVDCSILTELVS